MATCCGSCWKNQILFGGESMSKVEVAEIVVRFPDGTEKSMPVADARELHRQLSQLFGANQSASPAPVVIERNHWPRWIEPSAPRVVPDTGDVIPKSPKIWCKS